MTLDDIIAAIPGMEHAETPHRYSPTSCGDVARQLLLLHPQATRSSLEEVRELVRQIATMDANVHRPYFLEGRAAGNIGGPGTWISTGHAGSLMLSLSPNVSEIYDADRRPVDPTVVERVTAEIGARIETMGGDPSAFRILRMGRSDFAGDDIVHFATEATESGEDSFSGFFSHLTAPYSPGVQRSLDAGAATVLAHSRHAGEIRRRTAAMRDAIAERFAPIGSTIGETLLVSVEADATGLLHVHTATHMTALGPALTWTNVMLRMGDPHQVGAGEFDGFQQHYKDTRRRQKLMAGREPMDVYTVCPVVARSLAMMNGDEASENARRIRDVVRGKEDDTRQGQGKDFADGKLLDTVRLSGNATFRKNTLMVKGTVLPDTVLAALEGRSISDVHSDPRLEGLIVQKAKMDSKGRLVVTVVPPTGVPLRPLLEALEARG